MELALDYYSVIRNLPIEEQRGAWVTTLKKGDSLTVKGITYLVTTKTKKTLRLKSDDKVISFSVYGNNVSSEKNQNFFRDCHGILNNDLSQQFNRFHVPSDIFTLTCKAIDIIG